MCQPTKSDERTATLSNNKVVKLSKSVVVAETPKDSVSPVEAIELPFTLQDIRQKIPKECFEKSLARSMMYMARDWAIVASLLYYKSAFDQYGGIIGHVLWWNLLGFWGWCLFVVGHDCGHGTFSNSSVLNGIIGHICHAPLCVPFYGWAKSHSEHHKFHNHVDKDHSWKPFTKTEYDTSNAVTKVVRFSPFLLLLYPYYLLKEATHSGFSGNHFNPFSVLFSPEERVKAAISSASVISWVGFLAYYFHGNYLAMLDTYWVPYFIFCAWLDLVTFLQHTDEKAYYFSKNTWSYLRGALSTVDRTYKHIIDPFNIGYGRIIDHLHHNISDGHVVHHLFFTSIPHYNLIKATKAVAPFLGKHYMWDETPVPLAFMKSINNCHYVEDDADIAKYTTDAEYNAKDE